MSLRRRLVLLAAGTVGATVLLASVICYLAMRSELRGEIDDQLVRQGDRIQRVGDRFDGPPRGGREFPVPPPPGPGEGAGVAQFVARDGSVVPGRDSEVALPVSRADLEIASGGGDARLADAEAGGTHLRVLTVPLPGGEGAVQLARSLESTDATLSRLRLVLALLVLSGTALALAVSRLLAERVIAPVSELTEAAEHVSETEDLSRRIDASGTDEVGRMASRFNAMLDRLEGSRAALADSVAAQRQLVADASHELRTPVTSLRTNVEVLLDGAELGETERERLLADVREQSEELSLLINDVIELARGDQPLATRDDVRLDEVVAEAVARARRNAPGTTFETQLAPVVVDGDAERLARAAGNLLDNAAKHSDRVEVELSGDAELTVRDHGAGVPDAEKALVFERFYRGEAARGRPGSGLGLAIVRQVAQAHGGTVSVEDAPGGGALFRMRL